MAETDDELAAQDARYRAICRSAIELLRLSNQLLPDASTREQIKKLNRPIHTIGLRFMLPPFKQEGAVARKEDWLLEVKTESLMEDPHRLYIEADGRWQNTPMQWDDEATQTVVNRLVKVSEYLKDHVLDFLIHAEGGE